MMNNALIGFFLFLLILCFVPGELRVNQVFISSKRTHSWPLVRVRKRNALIIAHYDENVEWALSLMEAGNSVSKSWSAIIYCKIPERAANLDEQIQRRNLTASVTIIREPENWGCEASAHLRYLVENYEDLPPLMFFVHGEPFSHTPFLQDMLSCANPDFERYFGAGHVYWQVHSINPEITAFKVFNKRYEIEMTSDLKNKELLINNTINTIVGSGISLYNSAQFLIGKSAVQRRPREVWKALLTTIMKERGPFQFSSDYFYDKTVNNSPMKSGAFWLEIIWHELFGKPRNAEWLLLEDICGSDGDPETPLLMTCCIETIFRKSISSFPCRTWSATDDRFSISYCPE